MCVPTYVLIVSGGVWNIPRRCSFFLSEPQHVHAVKQSRRTLLLCSVRTVVCVPVQQTVITPEYYICRLIMYSAYSNHINQIWKGIQNPVTSGIQVNVTNRTWIRDETINRPKTWTLLWIRVPLLQSVPPPFAQFPCLPAIPSTPLHLLPCHLRLPKPGPLPTTYCQRSIERQSAVQINDRVMTAARMFQRAEGCAV